jgi:hypothetical protein
VNADVIAASRWPDDPVGKSYEAAVVAAGRRTDLIANRMSFVTETVFSHESKLELVHAAVDAGRHGLRQQQGHDAISDHCQFRSRIRRRQTELASVDT